MEEAWGVKVRVFGIRLSSDAGMLGCPPLADEGMRG